MVLDRLRGRLQLGAEVAVVVGDGPGQVRGTSTVDDPVGLEHRVDPLVVTHVQLHRALLDREAKGLGPRLEHRHLGLGLRDLGLRGAPARSAPPRSVPATSVASTRAASRRSCATVNGSFLTSSSAITRPGANAVIAVARATSAMRACGRRIVMKSASSRAGVLAARVRVSTKPRVRLERREVTARPRKRDRRLPGMSRSILQRRLVDVSERLKRIRAELGVTEEQLVFLEEEADDVRLRSLVAETPIADVEARDRAPPGRRPRPSPRRAAHDGAGARGRAGSAPRSHLGRAVGSLTHVES